MAVSLALSYSERNDNKVLTLTDTTADWGAPEIDTSAITTLTLDVTITDSSNTTVVYTQIDLVSEFGSPGFATQADMVFPLDCTHLVYAGTALGTTDDELPDGIYTFTYIVDEGLASEDSYTESILVEGRVRVAVYEALRALPVIYNCSECKTKEMMDTIFCYGLLNAMEAAGYVAKNEELINQLYTLERVITYGTSYSW